MLRRQRSLQYLTSSQTFSHFLRQLKGRPQTRHVLDGRCCFLTSFMRPRFLVNVLFLMVGEWVVEVDGDLLEMVRDISYGQGL